MAVVSVTRDAAYTQINSAAARVQVFGGRVRVADSATPADKDFHVWPEGSVIDITANKYAQAVDDTETWVVRLAV